MNRKSLVMIAIGLAGLLLGYQLIMNSYYKLSEPAFLKHQSYISTEIKQFPVRLYYFTNRNSDVEAVDIKWPDNKMLDIKFKSDFGEGYSKYHDQHRVDLELVGMQPGETEISELTLSFSDGSEKTVEIGNIIYKFRKPSGFFGSVSIKANGSSSDNRDFAQYDMKKPLVLKKIYYRLPQLEDDILKVVQGESINLSSRYTPSEENPESPSDILRADIMAEENLQNIDLSIKLLPQKPLLLTSYFAFKNTEQCEKKIYSLINAELIFIDEAGQEIIGAYNGEYLPYLKASEIRDLSNSKTDNAESKNQAQAASLPPLERVIPEEPYLFLPLEYTAFQLFFTQEVDPVLLEKAVSFEPELNFKVQGSKHNPQEIYIDPQDKLRPDTTYVMKIKGIQNLTTGKVETLKFTYRSEFEGDKEIINPEWSHDGQELVYLVRPEKSDTAELWKINIKNGDKKLLATGLGWPGRASWSPDDSSILYTKMIPKSDKIQISLPEICSVDREGKKEKVAVPGAELERMAGVSPFNAFAWWSSDGKRIAVQLDIGGLDAHSDMIRSIAVVNSDGKGLHPVEGQIFVGWKDNNSLLVLKTHQNYNHSHAYRYDLFQVNRDGKDPGKLLLGEGQIPNFDQAGQSPDLNAIVLGHWKSLNAVSSFKTEGTGISLYDLSQNTLTPMESSGGYQKHPSFSSDGKSIVFTANKAGNWDLYLWESGKIKQLTKEPGHELYPIWSPKGDKLAFVSRSGGTEEIKILELSLL